MPFSWHTQSREAVLLSVKSRAHGLSQAEAKKRLQKQGPNELPQEKPYPAIRLFLNQFNSPLMYIIGCTALISLYLGHLSDAIFIFIVMLSNVVVGFYQEQKANRSLAALKRLIKMKARVVRDGAPHEIEARELVVGDIIHLQAGDRVPADARLLNVKGLRINEATLTGESMPTEKTLAPLSSTATIGDQTNMAFLGTLVAEGWGEAVVVETGSHTQMGAIMALLKETKEELTPLQVKIASLSKMTGAFILGVVALVGLEGYFNGRPFEEVFTSSLALAVSAIPEGLLPAITVILALGMYRILKQNGLVRRLAATETLGGVTVICTDKTGTLTEGNMAVTHVVTADSELSGKTLLKARLGQKGLPESVALTFQTATYTNEAYEEAGELPDDPPLIRGRLTEQALFKAARRFDPDGMHSTASDTCIDRITFSSEFKYSASLCSIGEKTARFSVMGAPEQVLAHVDSVLVNGSAISIKSEAAQRLAQRLEELTRLGLRVVACAYRDVSKRIAYQSLHEWVDGLTLAGYIALEDPVRQDVPEAFALTKRAGIRTVIVTGDHKLTAKAIAEQIGFEIQPSQIMEGIEIEGLDDETLRLRSKTTVLYARVSPQHKQRIVHALQANEEVVAMFGDGVNDAPALKSANIGVAVGDADVVREVADIVLLDNGFNTIVKAVEQGRIIFANIRKVFIYLVAQDFAELFIFIVIMAIGLPLPLLPAQILWINLVESGLPDIALTAEEEKDHVMDEPPRRSSEPILNRPLKYWLVCMFFISGIVATAYYFYFWFKTGDIEKTRSMVFLLKCMESLLFAFSVRSFKRSLFRRDIFSNRWLVGAVIISFLLVVAAFTFAPLQSLLAIKPLSVQEWVLAIAGAFFEICLIELAKKRIFRYQRVSG